jgi:hypothetical protein
MRFALRSGLARFDILNAELCFDQQVSRMPLRWQYDEHLREWQRVHRLLQRTSLEASFKSGTLSEWAVVNTTFEVHRTLDNLLVCTLQSGVQVGSTLKWDPLKHTL